MNENNLPVPQYEHQNMNPQYEIRSRKLDNIAHTEKGQKKTAQAMLIF